MNLSSFQCVPLFHEVWVLHEPYTYGANRQCENANAGEEENTPTNPLTNNPTPHWPHQQPHIQQKPQQQPPEEQQTPDIDEKHGDVGIRVFYRLERNTYHWCSHL